MVLGSPHWVLNGSRTVLVEFYVFSRARRFTRFCAETIENVNLQQLPSGRLRTPREQNDRAPLGEYYIFYEAIPPKVESSTATNYWYDYHLHLPIREGEGHRRSERLNPTRERVGDPGGSSRTLGADLDRRPPETLSWSRRPGNKQKQHNQV